MNKLLSKIKENWKVIIEDTLIGVLSVTLLYTSIPLAKADSSAILSSNKALGSPILNQNFTTDNWNKWETVAWGVFLGNFVMPFVDTYQSAFKTTGTGTNGAGYQALAFSTGNDSKNNDIIKEMCDYAISEETSTAKPIYVMYAEISGNEIQSIDNPNSDSFDTSEIRPACVNDLFVAYKDNDTKFKAFDGTEYERGHIDVSTKKNMNVTYTSMIYATSGKVPVFYVKDDLDNYVVLLDFRESWDIQMFNAMLNYVNTKAETYQTEFANNLKTEIDNGTQLFMDCFGNITCNGKMAFLAAANPNITETRSINLVNSWVMNGISTTTSKQALVDNVRQEHDAHGNPKIIINDDEGREAGMPGVSDTTGIGSQLLLYYDIDNIVMDGGAQSYGNAVLDLWDLNINDSNNRYPLKIGFTDAKYLSKWDKFITPANSTDEMLTEEAYCAELISTISNSNGKVNPKVLNTITNIDGAKTDIFGENMVLICNQLLQSSQNEDAALIRRALEYMYEIYTEQLETEGHGKINKDTIKTLVGSITSWKDLGIAMNRYNIAEAYASSSSASTLGGVSKTEFKTKWDWANNNSFANTFGDYYSSRMITVVQVTETMKSISNYLGLSETHGNFDKYASLVYMSYLDWYGVLSETTQTSGTEKVSKFNKQIFSESSDILTLDPATIISEVGNSDANLAAIQNYLYLLLDPVSGTSYRTKMTDSLLENFVYEHYNRIAFGGASDTYKGSSSKESGGFFNISLYEELPFISLILNNYAMIAMVLILACSLLFIVVGLIKSKRASWYILSLFAIINLVLLIPTLCNLTPYIANRAINKMYSDKMTFWAISEAIGNSEMESSLMDDSLSISGQDATTILSFVKTLGIVQADNSIMLKQDISQKVTIALADEYREIQSLQSARWLLPILMQQISGERDTTDYLYVSLANVNDDMTNMYWYFNPTDSTTVTSATATSYQTDAVHMDKSQAYNAMLSSYGDSTVADSYGSANNYTGDINFRSYCYTQHADMPDLVHRYNWAIIGGISDSDGNYTVPTRIVDSRANTFGTHAESYSKVNDWENYYLNSGAAPDQWRTDASNGFEDTADVYNRLDRNTITPDFGYLKTTESPIYYFFSVVKDTFDTNDTYATLINMLVGDYTEDSSGSEKHLSFMLATEGEEKTEADFVKCTPTGYSRDVLDLEYFFGNVIPYLYQTTLIAGGFDGESGILSEPVYSDNGVPLLDEDGNNITQGLKISDELQYYKGENQSWMYRCNWATKIMENPSYAKAGTVRDKDGTEYKVSNMLLMECYPNTRPMIFSEAQMKAYELDEGDLNLVELKCVQLNKNIYRDWSALLNYSGTEGMTKEILMRQMALVATIDFNQLFSTGDLIDTIYELYPQGLDLRYLSIDAVFKIILMNASNNASYKYASTIGTLIEQTNVFTAFLLLAVTYLCAIILPLFVACAQIMILLVGISSTVMGMLKSANTKVKIICASLVNNIVFLIYTLAYYFIISLMMKNTSSDEVLVSYIAGGAQLKNPTWALLIITLVTGAYIFVICKHIIMLAKNWKDGGWAVIANNALIMREHLSDLMGKVSDGITSLADNVDSDGVVASSTNNISGSGNVTKESTNVNVTNIDGNATFTEKTEEDNTQVNYENYSYQDNSEVPNEYIEVVTADDIDNQIEEGREMNESEDI